MSKYIFLFSLVLVYVILSIPKDTNKNSDYINQIPSSSGQVATEKSYQPSSQPSDGLFLVTKVVDGDTIEIETGDRVRYIGINTPETTIRTDCFGRESKNKNKDLVENKRVKLEKDVSDTDKYGRLLRYIYVADKMVNEELVREGYAYSSTYPPDVKYQQSFFEAEKEARENNRGLWNRCESKVNKKGEYAPKAN